MHPPENCFLIDCIYCNTLKFGCKNEGQEAFDIRKTTNSTSLQIAQNTHWRLLSHLVFCHHLTAGATGGCLHKNTLRIATHHSQGLHSLAGMCCRCCKQGGPLCTKSRRIGQVFLVAPRTDHTSLQSHRSPHMKVRIRHIRSVGSLHCRTHQSLVISLQFVYRIILAIGNCKSLFHILCIFAFRNI